jgi:CMP/dCMP kinase
VQGIPTDLVVAIDGPSGSGKSSTSRGVARALGLRYLDTGAMYRAVTWWMLRHGIDIDDPAAIAARAGDPVLVTGTDPAAPTIMVDGLDVAGPIRSPEVTIAVSAVSAVPEVRAHMVRLQREIIDGGGIVVEGRDIGSVVAPEAEVKVFLTAHASARAHRRTAELAPGTVTVEATRADLARRDRIDAGRATSPLMRADDAHVLDTTELTLEEAVAAIVDLARDTRRVS